MTTDHDDPEEERLASDLEACDHGGFFRFTAHYRVGEKLIEVDTIVATLRSWETCAEADHPEDWDPKRSGHIVYAQRVIC
jgi:hypothetical protein